MRIKFELLGEVLRVEVLISSKDSRPIFKVEEFGISGLFERALAIPGLRVAAATDDPGLHAAHEYVELLAAQRGVAFRAFTGEREALAWLRSGAA